MKKYQKTILKILVSVSLYAIIFYRIDVGDVASAISLVNPAYVPVIILFLILNYVVSSVRWKILIIFKNADRATIPYLTRLYFMGAFFNNFLPTSIGGDSYKIYKLSKKLESVTNAFTATFMERFTGVIALVLISYVGLVWAWDTLISLFPASVSQNSTGVFWLRFMLFFGFWIALILSFYVLKLMSKRFPKVAEVYNSFAAYSKERGVLVWAFTTSFIVQLLAISTQYLIFLALGVELPTFYALFVLPVITLASFFIPSLNGVGVQDLLYVQLFQAVGVEPATALSASILYHLSRLTVSLVGGVFYAIDKDS